MSTISLPLSHARRPERLALALSGFFSAASIRAADTLLPAFAQDFHLTAGATGAAVTSFMLAYGLLQWLYGPMADRFGTVRVIRCALIASTLANLAQAAAPSFTVLIALRAVAGAMAAGVIPLCIARLGDTEPMASRQALLARYSLATICGLMAGQWSAGLIADRFGWRLTFVVMAAGFAAAATAMLVLRGPAAAPIEPATPAPETAPKASGTAASFGSLLALRTVRITLAITLVLGVFGPSMLAFVPTHVATRFGTSLGTAGAVVALHGVGGLLFALAAPMLIRQMGRARLALLGGALVAAGMLTLAAGNQSAWAATGCLLGGCGYYMLLNTVQTFATQMAPERRASAIAVFAFCLFAGQGVGVWAGSRVLDLTGAAPLFATSAAALLLVGATLAQQLRQALPQRHRLS